MKRYIRASKTPNIWDAYEPVAKDADDIKILEEVIEPNGFELKSVLMTKSNTIFEDRLDRAGYDIVYLVTKGNAQYLAKIKHNTLYPVQSDIDNILQICTINN